ncbi:MAG: YkgJ family cysteine cluster protein [Candidatus Micrarchaeota archaeon]
MTSLIERLPKQRIVVNKLPKRPANAREKIGEVFAKKQCTSCGECCRNWGIRNSFVPLKDGEGRKIREKMHGRELTYGRGINTAITISQGGQDVGLYSNFNGDCYLLSERACLVHEVKPHNCRVFPLAGMTENLRKGIRLEYLMLSQKCTAIREISYAAIPYIELDDICDGKGNIVVPMVDFVLQYFLKIREEVPGWKYIAIARVMGKDIIPIRESVLISGGFFREIVPQ